VIASLRSPILLAALAGCIVTPPVLAHGDVTPQAVDVSTLKKLGDNWLDENPYRKDQEAERVGASAYNQNCARCHGLEAISGGIAPDLRKLDIDKETDQYYAASVRRGKVRNGAVYMPPFEGILSQEAVWAIKAYLETRREPEEAGPANPMEQLAKTSSCLSCHGVDNRMVGPAYREIAKRYERDRNAEAKLLRKVKQGGVGVWGKVPMPPMNTVPEKDLRSLVKWILAGAR
jgi:cytochrome c-550 PedF